jgi:hypothetical protein
MSEILAGALFVGIGAALGFATKPKRTWLVGPKQCQCGKNRCVGRSHDANDPRCQKCVKGIL